MRNHEGDEQEKWPVLSGVPKNEKRGNAGSNPIENPRSVQRRNPYASGNSGYRGEADRKRDIERRNQHSRIVREREEKIRQEEEARLKKQRMYLIIIAAAVVICLVLLLVLIFGNFGKKKDTGLTAETDTQSGTETEGLTETEEETDSVDEPIDLAAIELPDYVTEDLIPVNEFSRCGKELEQVNALVVHYVGNPNTTAANNVSYFKGLADQDPEDTGAVYASSNFVIGLEGEIINCVPITEIAYCSNDRNGDTLSIEVCHPDETGQFNDATYESLIRLMTYLCAKLDLESTDIIRHYDVTGKLCPLYYVEHPEAWEQMKLDLQVSLEDYLKEL